MARIVRGLTSLTLVNVYGEAYRTVPLDKIECMESIEGYFGRYIVLSYSDEYYNEMRKSAVNYFASQSMYFYIADHEGFLEELAMPDEEAPIDTE